MFVPSAKSKLSLLVLMLASIILFVWVENSRIFVSDQYFEEKLANVLMSFPFQAPQ